MNKIKICDNCKKITLDTLLQEIKVIDSEIDISIGCQNFCGICSKKAFVILNNIPIIAETMDELIEEIKLKISK
jgi:uncharacterized protein YuzB (UPF0349 family)